MKSTSEALRTYMQAHPFDSGDPDCTTVLDQLYRAYTDSTSLIHLTSLPSFESYQSILRHYLWIPTTVSSD